MAKHCDRGGKLEEKLSFSLFSKPPGNFMGGGSKTWDGTNTNRQLTKKKKKTKHRQNKHTYSSRKAK
jgi:hypothetical protein